MKTNLKKSKNIFYLTALVLMPILSVLTGCSKDRNDNVLSNEEARVSFNVGGVNEETAVQPNALMASIGNSTTGNLSNIKTVKSGNFNIDMSVETLTYSAGAKASASVNRDLYATTTPMTQNYTYRVLLYDNTGTFITSIDQAATGSAPTIQVDLVNGGSYTWYAYSYNESAALPSISTINTSDPQITPPVDKDLLFATGTFVAKAGINHQAIVFDHVLSRVKLSVDSYQANSSIESVNASFTNPNPSYFKTGTFGLKTQAFTNIQSYNPSNPLTLVDPTPTITPNQIRQGIYYTVPDGIAINGGNFWVQVSASLKDLTSGTVTATPISILNFNSVVPTKGKSININISYRKTTGIIGNRQWAQGNLYYENGLYQIRADDTTRRPIGSFSSTDFWRWGSTLPNTAAANSNAYVDACTKVLPVNTWRTPVQADFIALSKAPAEHVAGINGYQRYKDDNGNWITFKYDGRSGYADTTSESDYWIQDGSVFEQSGLDNTGNQIYTFFPKSALINIRCVRDIN